jgi:hypothetical protein
MRSVPCKGFHGKAVAHPTCIHRFSGRTWSSHASSGLPVPGCLWRRAARPKSVSRYSRTPDRLVWLVFWASACSRSLACPFFIQNAAWRPRRGVAYPRGRAGVGFRLDADALTGALLWRRSPPQAAFERRVVWTPARTSQGVSPASARRKGTRVQPGDAPPRWQVRSWPVSLS